MKVIVGYTYTVYTKKEIKIDDKFMPATTQDRCTYELWSKFYREICRKIGEIADYDKICSIENPDNGYHIGI